MADEEVCKECRNQLVRVIWNEDTDMLVCDYYKCSLFRNPIVPGNIKPKPSKRRKTNVPDTIGRLHHGTENTSFTRRLQRLRGQIYSED